MAKYTTRKAIKHQLDQIIQKYRDAQKALLYIKELAPDGHEQVETLVDAALEGTQQISDLVQAVNDKW